jgi:hypothetical protein
MLQPTNSAAEQIVSLRSINGDIDTQIATLQAAQQKNLDTITAFEEIATWVDIEETPVVVVIEETPVAEEPPIVEPTVPVVDVVVDEQVSPSTDPIVDVVVEEVAPAPVVEPVEDPAPSEPLIVSAPKPRSSKAKK